MLLAVPRAASGCIMRTAIQNAYHPFPRIHPHSIGDSTVPLLLLTAQYEAAGQLLGAHLCKHLLQQFCGQSCHMLLQHGRP